MTEHQGRCLAALAAITADGWPASIREVQRSVGLASVSTAHAHMLALEREGLAEMNPRQGKGGSGGWRPTVAGLATLEAFDGRRVE